MQPLKVTGAESTMVPKTMLELEPKDAVAVLKLMERLEDLDDVQRVHTNLEISEEALKQFEGR